MRRIIYAGETFLTSPAIADALFAYAAALAPQGAARVTIPVADLQTGTVHDAEFVLGPASQLVSEETSESGIDFPDEEAIVRDLTERRQQLEPATISDDTKVEEFIDLDLPEEVR